MVRFAVLLCLFFFSGVADAAERLAVLEIESSAVGAQERALLTDALRGGAVTSLSGRIKVMTRENMEVMLSDMGIDASCVAEGACEVETARNLGVDYVLSGSVAKVSGILILSVKLHETRGGELLGSDQSRAKDVLALMDAAPKSAQMALQPIGGRAVSSGGAGGAVADGGGGSSASSSSNSRAPRSAIPQSFRGLEKGQVVESDALGELVCVSGGAFVVGSPPSESGRYADEFQRRVNLPTGICAMKTEVSLLQIEMLTGRKTKKERKLCGDDCPAERVSWLDAVRVANAASAKDGLAPAYSISGSKVTWKADADGYRLPTEAEWEALARGREDVAWAGGGSAGAVGYTQDNASSVSQPCIKQPNGYGLCDLSGNVAEWVWDVYDVDFADYADNPMGPEKGRDRVIKGGSYRTTAADARVAFRTLARQDATMAGVGFRLVKNQ